MKNITQRDIASPPNKYEAYLYRYTNLENQISYVGIHKGSVDDSYKHSSACKEFADVFNNADSKLKFEVLKYGSYLEMRTSEHSILKKDDARNNPMYYNKTNGHAAYVEPREDMIKLFVEQINDGSYESNIEDIAIHTAMDFIQVRFEHNAALQKSIKHHIDDRNGNTDRCDPLTVLEGRGEKGQDKRLDGNTTLFGAAQSKHATKIPVRRIPYESHIHLTDFEINRVGRLLNKKAEVEKKATDKKDAIKDILEAYSNGIPVSAPSNVSMLKLYGFPSAMIFSINKEVKQLIAKEEGLKNNQLFINYNASPDNKTLKDVSESFSYRPGCCSVISSSAKLSVERILEKLYANAIIKDKVDNKKCMVVIHHPSVEDAHLWKTKIQPAWIEKLDKLLKLEYVVEFYEMDMWKSDGSKKAA